MRFSKGSVNSQMTPTHLLIRGYRRHGKDTFAKSLARGDLTNYQIFSVKGVHPSILNTLFHASIDHFADPLKEDVSSQIGKYVLKHMESFKDDNIITLPVTIRELLIEEAARQRGADPDVYAKIVTERNISNDVLIPDFRYPNEFEYGSDRVNKVVVQVWHSETPEPDVSVSSERGLDRQVPDFIVLRDFKDASQNRLERERYSEYAVRVGLFTLEDVKRLFAYGSLYPN